jgi:CheY-like chemotaxis protein
MFSFEEFKRELRNALTHLHDPDYPPTEVMYAMTGCDPRDGGGPVQAEIIQVIEGLEPSPEAAPTARSRRDFDILHNRFVLRLTQDQTAARLHMSVRNLRRVQREATHTLARLLWEHGLARKASTESDREDESPSRPALDWRAQVRQDLDSLRQRSPESVTDVGKAIKYAVELETALASKRGIDLRLAHLEPDLVAAIHPSLLRQALIMAIAQVARCVPPGPIAVRATAEGEHILISLEGRRAPGAGRPVGDLIDEILSVQEGSANVRTARGQISFHIRVPSVGKATVLIVDDNRDIVHFFRRCLSGTRYHIVHAAYGQRTVEAIEAIAPDVIVLDIILPDVDGWDLLSRLHAHPATRSTPIIICSIVREEELATALGAVYYLPKPVQRQGFLQALDEALTEART